MMDFMRKYIATLQEGSYAGMFSQLCGPRNSNDKLPPQVFSNDNVAANITTPYLPNEIPACHGVCDGCGRSLNPPGSIVFVLGAPGTGKGTQCAFLAQEFGFHHLSYGDLCRRLSKDPNSIVSRLDVKKGSNNPNVPDDFGAWLVWKEIRTAPGRRWLVDGFPKRAKHLEEFLNLMPAASLTLILDCPQDVSIRRVANRGRMAGPQARPEDLDENISSNRIMDSQRNMKQVLQALRDRGCKFVVIDTNRTEDLIQDELRQIMSLYGLAA